MNKSDQISELKSQVENFKLNRANLRETYPQYIRDAVKRFYQQGMAINHIASLIGVPYDSVQNWVSPAVSSNKFKELKIKSTLQKPVVEKPEDFHIVIYKNGFEVKVESPSVDFLLNLLRGL